jgi:hypothetical protein
MLTILITIILSIQWSATHCSQPRRLGFVSTSNNELEVFSCQGLDNKMTHGRILRPAREQEQYIEMIHKHLPSHENIEIKKSGYINRKLADEGWQGFGPWFLITEVVVILIGIVVSINCICLCLYALAASLAPKIDEPTTVNSNVHEQEETLEARRRTVIQWLFPVQNAKSCSKVCVHLANR